MEDGLVQELMLTKLMVQCVLILIVVEDGLVPAGTEYETSDGNKGLNPYCSGRWSRTVQLDANERTIPAS